MAGGSLRPAFSVSIEKVGSRRCHCCRMILMEKAAKNVDELYGWLQAGDGWRDRCQGYGKFRRLVS